MFKKLFLCLLLCLIPAVVVLSQITVVGTRNIYTPKVLTVRNVVGASLETVYFPGDIDTLRLMNLQGTVLDTFRAATTHRTIVQLIHTSFNPRPVGTSPEIDETYTTTDTLQTGDVQKLPYAEVGDMEDSLFHLVLISTDGQVSPGDIFSISIEYAPWDIEATTDTISRIMQRPTPLFEDW